MSANEIGGRTVALLYAIYLIWWIRDSEWKLMWNRLFGKRKRVKRSYKPDH